MYLKSHKNFVLTDKQQAQIPLPEYMYLETNGITSVLDTKHNSVLIMVWFSIVLVVCVWLFGFFFPPGYVVKMFAF